MNIQLNIIHLRAYGPTTILLVGHIPPKGNGRWGRLCINFKPRRSYR